MVLTVGDTVVLSTVATSKPREGIDFFPLTVDVEERMYAAGKIPGSFFRREGRPGEAAILTCRLTDRPLRPSFPEGFRNETQVIATILGSDQVNPHDVISINGASAALMISGIPFNGPIGAVRMAHHEGEWIAHPTYEEGAESTFQLVVAGRRTDAGEIAVMMVEAGGTEKSWELYEAGAPKVTEDGHRRGSRRRQGVDRQVDRPAAGARRRGRPRPRPDRDEAVRAPGRLPGRRVRGGHRRRRSRTPPRRWPSPTRPSATTGSTRSSRACCSPLAGTPDEPGTFAGREGEVKKAFRSLQKQVVRERIVNDGVRIDGRGVTDLRPLSAEVGIINTVHGSGLFQRGETQVLSVLTLGMSRMEQIVDTLGLDDRKRYMHHYNFPPFSTGETGRVGSPKRREIGHGALAERALLPVVPSKEEWPYTLRVVSDVLASNGSTSMASVCGSTLSLMDAGVPIKAPVAGIAMGLVYHDGKYTTLTDILGAEDAFGDMDFKVAGTSEFVTALQLDTKIDGLPADVLLKALEQAKDARLADPRGHDTTRSPSPARTCARPHRRSSASRSRSTRSAR